MIKRLSHDKALFRSYGAHQVTDTTIYIYLFKRNYLTIPVGQAR